MSTRLAHWALISKAAAGRRMSRVKDSFPGGDTSRTLRAWPRQSAAACRRVAGPLAASLAILTLAALLVAPPAVAKSYWMPQVTIDATVRPDGSMQVTERRTFDFSGTFHVVYWDLETRGGAGISVQGVSTPSRTFERSNSGQPGTYSVGPPPVVRVEANFELKDTTVPFTLRYVVKGAAKRWSDTAELYWQFIGDGWAESVGKATIDIHLPPGVRKDQIRAWGHGPLNGAVTTNADGSVTLRVAGLQPNTYVGARVLFPAAALASAPLAGGTHLRQAMAEEAKLAAVANAERSSLRLRARVGGGVGGAVIAAGVTVWLCVLVRYRRGHKASFRQKYFRDIPAENLPPALVGWLWRRGGRTTRGSIGSAEITATILDLANRGIIDLQSQTTTEQHRRGTKERTTYSLVLRRDEVEELSSEETALVDLLFPPPGSGDTVTVDELRKKARTDAKGFRSGLKQWATAVRETAVELGLRDRSREKAAVVPVVAGFVAFIVSMFALVYSQDAWLLIGMGLFFFPLFTWRAVMRSPAEVEVYAKYRGVYNYLKDFGRMQEKPPTSVVLWEQFLVLATVFGLADKVTKSMQVKVPEVVNDPAFTAMTGQWIAADVSGDHSPLAVVGSGFSAAASALGAGDGFSGGGDGGGGGGGGAH